MNQRLSEALNDLDREAAVRPGDEDLILRAADAVLARSSKRHVASRVVQVAAAAILMLSAGASAAWWVVTASRTEPVPQVEDKPERKRVKRVVVPKAPIVATAAEPAPVLVAPVERRHERALPQAAAELFHAASVARGAGDVARAQRLYGQLIARHPDSDEAHVAHVALGKLLLASKRASAAEREFRHYLDAGGGPLSEEALFSRAQALQRLNRVIEERAMWTKLLSAYPHSVYAAHAAERLAEP